MDPLDAYPGVQVPADDPDALYKDRENLASARKATGLWTARLTANPGDFTSASRLAQARYWLGTNGLPEPQREEHLRKALTYNPQSVISHIFLGDTLAGMGRKNEARREYQAAIDAPFDPDWTPEDRRFKEQARRLLRNLR